jgi:glycosyltransferase involved in cell wall biosynthesis
MLSVAVIVATKGRPEVVRALTQALREQTSQPEALIVSACDPADVEGVSAVNPAVRIVFGPPGLPRQRNAALALVPSTTDVIVFFDDDFIPSRYWIERVRKSFERTPDIVSLTGEVLADGIKTEGIEWTHGVKIVADADASRSEHDGGKISWRENYSPLGCNMAFRHAAMADLRFDERLVLYAWQEDRDFGARIGRRGRMAWTDALWGVHLGIKGGRVRGRKLGYSQIVNPRYLVAKGTMRISDAVRLAAGNVIANAVKSLRPEPYIDRAGRLTGNLLGLFDLITGKWKPERAAEL